MKKITYLLLCLVLLGGVTAGYALSAETDESQGELHLLFFATPSQVVKGDEMRLDWESDDADYCIASGAWTGRKGVSGSINLIPKKKTQTYTLQCFDDDGAQTEKFSYKVTVDTKKKIKQKKLPSPTPDVSYPSHARADGEARVSWSSPKGTVACWAQGGSKSWEGLKLKEDSEMVEVEIGKEYSLTCWNKNGKEGDTVTWDFKDKPHKYTARDAGLSSEYLPLWPDDFTLANDKEVYFVDFVRKEENSPETIKDDVYYFGKRIVIDPETNLRIEDKDILRQLSALPSQVPPDVDFATKRVTVTDPISYTDRGEEAGEYRHAYRYAYDDLNRFVNSGEGSDNEQIPSYSPEELRALAVDYTLDYLDLEKTDLYRSFYSASIPAIWFNGTVAGSPMYFVLDVFNPENEKIRTIIIDPYSGEDVTADKSADWWQWDRAIFTNREPIAAPAGKTPVNPTPSPLPEPPFVYPTPTPNPPETKGVVPPSEPPKTATSCPKGSTYSGTLQTCVQDAPAVDDSPKPTCAAGEMYSITLRQCVR